MKGQVLPGQITNTLILLGCPRKLVKWLISPTYKWGILGSKNPLILNIDHNFQRDIQAMTHSRLSKSHGQVEVSNPDDDAM